MDKLNLTLWIFIAVVSILYCGYITLKYGVQKSISASYNNLETPVKKSLYAWFIFGVALPMMILSNNTMGVIAGMFLALDFAAPTGGDKIQNFIHCLGADVGMILGIAMLGFIFHLWLLVFLAAFTVSLLYLLKVKNTTWWIEVTVLTSVWIGLFIEKII